MRNVVQMCLAAKKISHAWNHAFLLLAIALAWKWQLPEGIYQKTNLNGRAGHWGGSEVITTNNNLLFHFIGYNNDLLVLNQWKGALNRIMPSLLSLLKINVRACTYLGGLFDIMALGWALIWGTALIWGKTGSYMYVFLRYLTGPEQC